ncbi:N-acetyltransferase [Pseudoflavonifractor sp. 524-17]|uniref:GNAT family N-acetyltransferase n=1 Tax=Pseudoflavonifractor sp. 524-17 TaxID=2304577 RepID=UPI00137AC7AB|nr:GNAT family N-acetyltransferase [Pseudoflavonifractor sp. 524-17]NCE63451.1 N-acetyltransferase [Pseudoflavonifractor sp. 524-17]
MELETRRLILRTFTEEDAADFYAYCKDPRVGPAAGWTPHESVEESLAVIRDFLEHPGTLAVTRKGEGKVIGTAGFVGRHRRELPGPDDEIGYCLSPAYWGQGFIPEAVDALLACGFENRGLNTIWCGYYDGNQKSSRVVRKCGFTYRFTRIQKVPSLGDAVRLAYCWAMTRREWEERTKAQHI